MNVLWTQLMPEVATHTPGAPQTLVLNQIRNSAIELCRRSRVWRIYADPMSITAGQPDYDFPDVFQTEVQDIIRMWFIPDGNPINPITFEKADALLPNWRLMSQYRPYNYVVDHENQQFTLIYTPSETIQDCIGLRVSLRPSMTSIGIDSVIFEEYFEVIAAGAKAKLLAMPKKPWTDARAAEVNYRMFEAGVSRATIRAHRDNTRSMLQANAIPFGGNIGAGQRDGYGNWFR